MEEKGPENVEQFRNRTAAPIQTTQTQFQIQILHPPLAGGRTRPNPMEGDAASAAGDDPMDFTWTAGWEAACVDASPDPDPDPDPAPNPAPVPQEAESMILVSGPRVAVSGLRRADCRAGECVLFVNAGGCAIQGDDPSANLLSSDSFFQGGESIETSETIVEGGDYPSLYSSARYGNFSYRFDGLAPGDYYLDLHFAEIVHTAGPTGIRSFDVLVQQDKILSELDVFKVVGGNRPLQVLDIRAFVGSNGAIAIDFKGVRGNPMVCGICIRKSPATPAAKFGTRGSGLCKKCLTDVEISSPIQKRTAKLISKYEKQIEELTSQCWAQQRSRSTQPSFKRSNRCLKGLSRKPSLRRNL